MRLRLAGGRSCFGLSDLKGEGRASGGNPGRCPWAMLFGYFGPAAALVLAVMDMAVGGPCRADRIVLAPRALTAPAGLIRLESAFLARDGRTNVEWLTVGIPPKDLGLELELERFETPGMHNGTFGLQYTLTGNALSDIAPAFSVGVRDVLNKGLEGRAGYVVVGKTFGLSQAMEHITKDLKAHLGVGTGPMQGLFGGVENHFVGGFTAAADYVGNRFNASLWAPVTRYGQARIYTLSGHVFYGATLSIRLK